MAKGYSKIRMSYDELAYILSLFDVDTYVFFENQGRSIGVEKAVPLINDMIRKKWLIPGKNRYMMSSEIRQYVDHIKDHTGLFFVKSNNYNHCHDLLCYSLKNSVLSLEKDYNREEYILLSLNDAGSFVEMLEEEGYLRNIIPVNEEDLYEAEKYLADYEIHDALNSLAIKDANNAILSFECVSEQGENERDSFGWIPKDPFAEEDKIQISYIQNVTKIYVYGKELYPFIVVLKDKYAISIPYNKKNLVRILSGYIMGGL